MTSREYGTVLRLAVGAIGVCVLWPPGPATAAELHVPGQYATIQAAINAANHGDVVIVADGTYVGPGNKDLDFLGKAITVRSANGPNNCTIDCEENGRAFRFWRGEGAGSVVRGFSIEHAGAVGGGAILCDASGPTLVDCWLTGNRALLGSNIGGGALACVNGGGPLVSGCLMVDNHALGGFGQLGGNGGAIYCDASSSPVVTSCTIARNAAFRAGGAIYCGGGRPILTHCTITANRTRQFNAGALHFSSASPTIMNCQIDDNDASEPDMGGGISCTGEGKLILSNCTIADNDPAEGSDAGGLSCYGDAYAVVTNCIFWGNTPAQIYSESVEPATTVTYSDIQGGWTGQGNLNADPLFVVRDRPGDPFYGKYYLSQTATGDPNQLTDSPCVNAGDGTAQQASLWGYTTRTDLVGDDFDTAVDLGFHYPRDCDANGVPDTLDLAQGTHQDCNLNGIPDPCDILTQYGGSCDPAVAVCSEDRLPLSTQGDGVPDECYWRPTGRTFTDDADFDDGTLINVHHDEPNELQRCQHARPLPFLWVPDQAHGTVNRIYTGNDPTIGYRGEVLGEYLTAPNNAGASPSRTAVDLDGNLWATNRNDDNDGTGSAVKIGLTIGGAACPFRSRSPPIVNATADPEPSRVCPPPGAPPRPSVRCKPRRSVRSPAGGWRCW